MEPDPAWTSTTSQVEPESWNKEAEEAEDAQCGLLPSGWLSGKSSHSQRTEVRAYKHFFPLSITQ